jgi:hypothetical protein
MTRVHKRARAAAMRKAPQKNFRRTVPRIMRSTELELVPRAQIFRHAALHAAKRIQAAVAAYRTRASRFIHLIRTVHEHKEGLPCPRRFPDSDCPSLRITGAGRGETGNRPPYAPPTVGQSRTQAAPSCGIGESGHISSTRVACRTQLSWSEMRAQSGAFRALRDCQHDCRN